MSMFKCVCGHVINSTVYPSPHEFFVLSEAAEEEVFLKMSQVAHDFARSAEVDREKAIRCHLGDDYPLDVSNAEALHDILSLEAVS